MIRVFPSLERATLELERSLCEAAQRSVTEHGSFRIALSGGNTPRGLYQRLGAKPASRFPWEHTEVYFGDERAVGPRSPESNYRMARETLLSRAPLPRTAVHRIVTEGRSPGQAAREYARVVRPRKDGKPFFDVVLLGIGSDGHTASLFPGQPALQEKERWVVPVPHAGHEPFVPRITLTFPALASSGRVCFLVAGEDKSPVVARILGGGARPGPDRPASLVRSTGSVEWYLDAKAARGLPASPR